MAGSSHVLHMVKQEIEDALKHCSELAIVKILYLLEDNSARKKDLSLERFGLLLGFCLYISRDFVLIVFVRYGSLPGLRVTIPGFYDVNSLTIGNVNRRPSCIRDADSRQCHGGLIC